MDANAANDIESSAPEESFTKDHYLSIRLTADPADYKPQDWWLVLSVYCHYLLKVTREGFFLTTSGVVPERGWLKKEPEKSARRYQRVWHLREFADKPDSQCRWVATANLYANSIKAVASFKLHSLHRRNVQYCMAENEDNNYVFEYSPSVNADNYNCFVDSLHPSHG